MRHILPSRARGSWQGPTPTIPICRQPASTLSKCARLSYIRSENRTPAQTELLLFAVHPSVDSLGSFQHGRARLVE
jgi:hypothetical protein